MINKHCTVKGCRRGFTGEQSTHIHFFKHKEMPNRFSPGLTAARKNHENDIVPADAGKGFVSVHQEIERVAARTTTHIPPQKLVLHEELQRNGG